MNDFCIVTCAFREPYLTHNLNQFSTLSGIPVIAFRNELPYSEGIVKENIVERFQKSLYGFKPHAIRYAKNCGFKRIVWFDPSVLPTCDPIVLFDSLLSHPMLVIKGDNSLPKMCNEKMLRYYGVTEDEIKTINHIGGTVYGFNFNNVETERCFNIWINAEIDGIFGNQDEFMRGAWADESCMALSMYACGIKQYTESKFTYLNQKSL